MPEDVKAVCRNIGKACKSAWGASCVGKTARTQCLSWKGTCVQNGKSAKEGCTAPPGSKKGKVGTKGPDPATMWAVGSIGLTLFSIISGIAQIWWSHNRYVNRLNDPSSRRDSSDWSTSMSSELERNEEIYRQMQDPNWHDGYDPFEPSVEGSRDSFIVDDDQQDDQQDVWDADDNDTEGDSDFMPVVDGGSFEGSGDGVGMTIPIM